MTHFQLEDIFQQKNLIWLYITLLFAGLASIFLFTKKYFEKNSSSPFIVPALIRLRPPLFFFSILILLQIFMPFLTSKNLFLADHIIQPLLLLTFSWLLIMLVLVTEDWIKYKYNTDKLDNIRERSIRTRLFFIKRLLIILIALITISLILLNFPNVKKIGTWILTSAGILGIILGFAAQKSLANLMAGFQIAFTQPIRIDDVVLVEGEWGKVEEITLTYVVVHIWDHRRLVLPINYFLEKPFQNWTRKTSELIGTVFIYTDYNVSFSVLENELSRVLESSNLWDKKVNVLQVTNTSEKSIELRALVSARNSAALWDLRCYVRQKLIAFIKNNYPDSLPKIRIESAARVDTPEFQHSGE